MTFNFNYESKLLGFVLSFTTESEGLYTHAFFKKSDHVHEVYISFFANIVAWQNESPNIFRRAVTSLAFASLAVVSSIIILAQRCFG